jgi:putative hydrolase of the HAD superfamily
VQANTLLPQVRAAYLHPSAWRVYPDVPACLCALTEGGWRHVVLSNHVPELEGLVTELGLRAHFAQVFTSALSGYEKPHPQAFHVALRSLPSPAVVRMVGDSYAADVLGAESIGIPAILTRRHHPSASRYVPDLTSLPSMLARA